MKARAGRSRIIAAIFFALWAAPGNSMAGEQVLIGKRITLELPPGASHTAMDGIDSTVGAISGPGFDCQYDLGIYSDRLEHVENAVVEDVSISGRPGRLVATSDGFVGLHLTEIAPDPLGVVGLTITCDTSGPDARDSVRAMLRTVRVVGG